ncbi:GRIP and coiled-coil domain-containing protein 1 [Mantella aurantiaca]
MEKLAMNFGGVGGPSKKELQEAVETQRKQLLQYQSRLKDVVRAYKSLQKEKEALEASLRVLSSSSPQEAPPPEEPQDDQRSNHSEDSADTAGSLPRGGETSEDERGEGPAPGGEEASGSESGVSTASGDGGIPTPADTDRRMGQLRLAYTLLLVLQRLAEDQQNTQRFLQEEERIRSLESQVSELSELLGAAETSKQRDQLSIRKLRERVLQLETENKTIAMATSLPTPAAESLLIKPTTAEDNNDGQEPHGSALFYQQELQQVREEFERYKARAQGVLRTKGAREGELEAGKQKMADLKEKYFSLRLAAEEADNRHKAEMEAARKELVQAAQAHRQELEHVRKESRDNMARMEEDLRQHRERVLAVLAEKEQELEKLREAKIPNGIPPPSPDPLDNGLELPSGNSSAFLVYIEQISRKEAEIGNLRRRKHELEAEIQSMNERLAEKGEEMQNLRQQVEKALRDRSREGANMEYLKNVLLGFLTMSDPSGRQHTLSALLTVLHFSPEERNAAMRAQDGGRWWVGGMR